MHRSSQEYAYDLPSIMLTRTFPLHLLQVVSSIARDSDTWTSIKVSDYYYAADNVLLIATV